MASLFVCPVRKAAVRGECGRFSAGVALTVFLVPAAYLLVHGKEKESELQSVAEE